jgi:hypothetical protein
MGIKHVWMVLGSSPRAKLAGNSYNRMGEAESDETQNRFAACPS